MFDSASGGSRLSDLGDDRVQLDDLPSARSRDVHADHHRWLVRGPIVEAEVSDATPAAQNTPLLL
jgi:hypothetical protein